MKNIIKWIFGGLLMLIGITTIFFGGIVPALLYILAGITCIPPTFKKIDIKRAERKKPPIPAGLKYGTVLAIAFSGFVFAAMSSISSLPSDSQSPQQNDNKAVSETNIDGDIARDLAKATSKDRLKKAIKYCESFDTRNYLGTLISLRIAVDTFESFSLLINVSKGNPDKEISDLGTELEKATRSTQKKYFPVIRKSFVKLMAEKLWEDDIYVTVSGANSQVVTFTNGSFAANRNIADFQNKFIEGLSGNLRFKEVRYCWYKGQEDYTKYDLEVLPDDALSTDI